MKCTIKLIWEPDSKCWRTETSDIPGLWLEADTFDELVEQVSLAAPEILEFNCKYTGPVELAFEAIRVEHLQMVS